MNSSASDLVYEFQFAMLPRKNQKGAKKTFNALKITDGTIALMYMLFQRKIKYKNGKRAVISNPYLDDIKWKT